MLYGETAVNASVHYAQFPACGSYICCFPWDQELEAERRRAADAQASLKRDYEEQLAAQKRDYEGQLAATEAAAHARNQGTEGGLREEMAAALARLRAQHGEEADAARRRHGTAWPGEAAYKPVLRRVGRAPVVRRLSTDIKEP